MEISGVLFRLIWQKKRRSPVHQWIAYRHLDKNRLSTVHWWIVTKIICIHVQSTDDWWTEYWLKITHQSIDGLNIYPDLPKNHAQSTDGLNASAPVKITGIVHWWIEILLAVAWSPNSPLMDYMLLHSSKSHTRFTDGLKFFATDLINKYPVHWWIEFLPLPWQKKTQSTDGLKIVCWWNKNFRCFATDLN